MIEDVQPNAGLPVEEPKKPKRRIAARKPIPKPATGKKTLAAAVSAMVIAGIDLFLMIRYGLKLF